MEIVDYVRYRRAAEEIYALIHAERPAEAVELADSCAGLDELVLQLRAMAYTDAGLALGDREIVGRAPALWEQLGLNESQVAYNAANAEMLCGRSPSARTGTRLRWKCRASTCAERGNSSLAPGATSRRRTPFASRP
jgi:hypothetical protein